MQKIILASASPRRSEIFRNLGIPFEVVPSQTCEDTQITAPDMLVRELAKRKADEVFSRTGGIVVAADTVVALDGKVFGKPVDENDACRMLSSLSGRTHEVYTGICVKNQEKTVSRTQKTLVKFRALSYDEIKRYVATGEPLDKAGSYGISGRGALLVEKVDGDFWNVVGFPIALFGTIMREEFAIEIMTADNA